MTGDEMRFQRLLLEHRDRVWAYVCYLLGNRSDAEDVIQEVFLRAWRHLATLVPATTRPWLLRVAHNLCMDVLRQRAARARLDVDLEPPAASLREDPYLCYRLSETQRALVEALHRLNPGPRSIVVLHHLEGLTLQEVADVLGTSAGAVKVAVHRARKVLRELLAERYPVRAGEVAYG